MVVAWRKAKADGCCNFEHQQEQQELADWKLILGRHSPLVPLQLRQKLQRPERSPIDGRVNEAPARTSGLHLMSNAENLNAGFQSHSMNGHELKPVLAFTSPPLAGFGRSTRGSGAAIPSFSEPKAI